MRIIRFSYRILGCAVAVVSFTPTVQRFLSPFPLSSSQQLRVSYRTTVTLPKNKTDASHWIPNSFNSVDPSLAKDGILWFPIAQVHAILDLYNTTSSSSANVGISGDLAMDTLEGVVMKCFRESQHKLINGALLEQLEGLVWRFCELQLAPSAQVLQSLWMMHQYRLHASTAQQGDDKKASKQVGRSIRLLKHWYHWESLGVVARPPDSFLLHVLDFMLDTKVPMTIAAWDLYRSLHSYSTNNKDSPLLPREVYSCLISILSISSTEWNVRQCRVLQDMMEYARSSSDTFYEPTVEELRHVYACAAKSGRVQDAAWLMRLIQEKSGGQPLTRMCKLLFLEALLKSREARSTAYMAHPVCDSRTTGWCEDLGKDAYNLLLQKWSISGTPGAGNRAQAVFQRLLAKYQESGLQECWRPDEQSAYLVVLAFLKEPASASASFSHILNADKFVRTCVNDHRLLLGAYELSQSSYKNNSNKPRRIFDRLLGAYCSEYYTRGDERVVMAADELFQFFFIQHRRGNVREEPDCYHLGHILRLWNRHAMTTTTTTSTISCAAGGGLDTAASKSLEYFRLMQSLHEQGAIQSKPTSLFDNVRHLLGTLARSKQAGYGSVANELLQLSSSVTTVQQQQNDDENNTRPAFTISPYALGHMFWCVIKCYCMDGGRSGIEKAMAVMDQMDKQALHQEHPVPVRLMRESYQTVLRALTAAQNDNTTSCWAAECARGIKERMEQIERQQQQQQQQNTEVETTTERCPSDRRETVLAMQ